jgi:hypothetical protein
MTYKLKKEFEGMRITKKNMQHGKVTFDAYRVLPEHYENYVKKGFEELFEEVVEEVINIIVDKIVDKIEDVVDNLKAKRKPRK